MLRFLIFVIIAFLAYHGIKRIFRSHKEVEGETKETKVIDEMVQDPFCKTYIPRRESIIRTIDGQDYFFCSKECASGFEQEKEG